MIYCIDRLFSGLCGSLDGRGVWRRMDTCIHMVGSPCCSPETITMLLIRHTPIQNKTLKRKKLGIYKGKKKKKTVKDNMSQDW